MLCYTHINPMLLFSAFYRLRSPAPSLGGHFLLLRPFSRTYFALLERIDWPFLFQSRVSLKPRSRGICGGGGGVTWDVGAVFDVDSLPLAAKRSLKLLLPLFNTILSSPLSESFGRASIKYGLEHRSF